MTKNWFVVYTKPRHEKKVAQSLEKWEIDFFLPIKKELRQWADRKKWIDKPLFPGYLFVHIDNNDYYNVLNCPGIVKYIFHEGKPAVVKDKIIESVKAILNNEIPYETICSLPEIGDKIIIKKGALKGLEGVIVSYKGKHKIAIIIECINTTMLLEVNKSMIL